MEECLAADGTMKLVGSYAGGWAAGWTMERNTGGGLQVSCGGGRTARGGRRVVESGRRVVVCVCEGTVQHFVVGAGTAGNWIS